MSNKYDVKYNDRMLIVVLFVFLSFISLVVAFAVIMLLPMQYYNYRFIGMPFSFVLTFTIFTIISNPLKLEDIQESLREERSNAHFPISIIYSSFVKRKYTRIIISIILSLVVISIFGTMFKLIHIAILIDSILLFYCFLLLIKNYLVKYRVLQGFFGTNADEAKELLKFIIQNSKDIDFTDQNGKLREVFLPETVLSVVESYLPDLGEVQP